MADFGGAKTFLGESVVIEIHLATGDRVPKFTTAPAARVQNSTSQDQLVRGQAHELVSVWTLYARAKL